MRYTLGRSMAMEGYIVRSISRPLHIGDKLEQYLPTSASETCREKLIYGYILKVCVHHGLLVHMQTYTMTTFQTDQNVM